MPDDSGITGQTHDVDSELDLMDDEPGGRRLRRPIEWVTHRRGERRSDAAPAGLGQRGGMSDELSFDAGLQAAHIVVHPVDANSANRPFRRVDVLGTQVGKAYGLADVVEFLRRAGLDDFDVEDPKLIDWQGGGPHVWQ